MQLAGSHGSLMCRNKDGRFSLLELKQFASDWNYLGRDTQPHELQSVVHSLCMAQFWREIHTEDGLLGAIDWCAPWPMLVLAPADSRSTAAHGIIGLSAGW
jgi:hypothetical protein